MKARIHGSGIFPPPGWVGDKCDWRRNAKGYVAVAATFECRATGKRVSHEFPENDGKPFELDLSASCRDCPHELACLLGRNDVR